MGTEVESLKSAFSTNTNWAEWAAFAVFIGLLIDIAVILIFDLFDKDKSWWEIILAGIASAGIAVGVWGESHFGHRATAASSQLQALLETQAADANARAKDAEARVAEATLEIEQERTARLKLQATITDRRLTDEQKRRIRDVLSLHPGFSVIVVSRLTDTEGKIYGNDFIDAFKAAN